MSQRSKQPFPAGIHSILQSASLAPSSHNTQPWYFSVSEDYLGLYADRTRALAVNDPEDRELTISCGCALMNLRIAAANADLLPVTELVPDEQEQDLLAVVELHSSDRLQQEADLFASIPGRRTYRKRFEDRPVPGATLKYLAEAARVEDAWLEVVDSEEKRNGVARLVSQGDAIQWANPSWRRELAAWMHPRRQGDGLTVPGLVAPVAKAVVRTFDMGRGVAAKDNQLAAGSPLIAVLGSEQDGTEDWLRTGQALQRVLLKAFQQGLQASYLNQPIQVAPLRSKLRDMLVGSGFPQVMLRLGFPGEKIAAAPRRPLEDIVA